MTKDGKRKSDPEENKKKGENDFKEKTKVGKRNRNASPTFGHIYDNDLGDDILSTYNVNHFFKINGGFSYDR